MTFKIKMSEEIAKKQLLPLTLCYLSHDYTQTKMKINLNSRDKASRIKTLTGKNLEPRFTELNGFMKWL